MTQRRFLPFRLLPLLGVLCAGNAVAEPPFPVGTGYMDPDIITPADPTTFRSASYVGRGNRQMFDRRFDAFVTRNAFLVDASFDDGSVVEMQVNPEFGDPATALALAEKYAEVIGRLPAVLRSRVRTSWIHAGVRPFGGGNDNLLIHTGEADNLEAQGTLEEILVHEAAHTSLDPAFAASGAWRAAQAADGEFISGYARDFPGREDVAESFLPYLALRHARARIDPGVADTVARTIPNRIAFFDALALDAHPMRGVYAQEDMAGTWSGYAFTDLSGRGGAPVAMPCGIVLGASSAEATTEICGSVDGTASSTLPGVAVLEDDGEVLLEGLIAQYVGLGDARLDLDHSVLAGLHAQSTGVVAALDGRTALLRSLHLAVARPNDAQTSDLAGTWQLFEFRDDSGQADAGGYGWAAWSRSEVTFDDGGAITAGARFDSIAPDAPVAVAGSAAVPFANGQIEVGGPWTSKHSLPPWEFLDAGKTVIAGAGERALDGGSSDTLRLWIKRGSGYAPVDLVGTWHLYLVSEQVSGNEPLVTKLALRIAASGAVRGGLVDVDGNGFGITGTASVDTDGKVTLGGELGALFSHHALQLDAGKTVLGGVVNETDVDPDIGVRHYSGLLAGVKSLTSVPRLIAPVGSVPSTFATFGWTDNGGRTTAWRLMLGATAGDADVFDSGVLPAATRSRFIGGLPNDGGSFFARLWSRRDGVWSAFDTHLRAVDVPSPALPAFQYPGPGHTLARGHADFTWSSGGTSVVSWRFLLGSSPGAGDLFDSKVTGPDRLQTSVRAVPVDGRDLHATLWYLEGGQWRKTELSIVAADLRPALVSHADGDVLCCDTVTFGWDDQGQPVEDHAIWFGSAPGKLDLGYAWARDVNPGAPAGVDTLTFDRLPYRGETVHATFWWKLSGRWHSRPYTFTAVDLPDEPGLTSHGDGAAIATASATFAWDDNGVPADDHAIWFGSAPGGRQYGFVWANSPSDEPLTFDGLPLDARVVHATFHWKARGRWHSRPYTFTTGGTPLPALSSTDVAGGVLASGATFTAASATFGWDDAGLAVRDHAIWFGSTPGGLQYGYAWASDVDRASPQTVRTLTFDGLPYAGETVHVTLWWKVAGVWSQRAYRLHAATLPEPELTGPENATDADSVITEGEVLALPTATFTWNDHGVPVDDHALWFGSVPGGRQYGYVWATEENPGDPGAVMQLTKTGLPVDGSTVFTTFWWKVRGVWFRRPYVFTATDQMPVGDAPDK